MDAPMLLWVDLRFQQLQSDLYASISDNYQVHRVVEAAEITEAIRKFAPRLLLFDYDHPDPPGLRTLQQTKFRYPSLPILMLTEYHSESLAVWAFRTRAWDYFVKPVTVEDLSKRIAILSRLMEIQSKGEARTIHMPIHPIPVEVRFCNTPVRKHTILPAVRYIEANYPEKILLNAVARLCGMGPFQFSRAFKREQGMTFREFLIRYRINKALELMKNPHVSITDVAFAVGFNDLSHFARMFRRYIGVCPSKFRQENRPR